VVILAAIIFALVICRRRKPSRPEVDPRPGPMAFEVRPTTFDPASALYNSHRPQPSASSFPATDSNGWRTTSFQPSQSSAPTHSASALIPQSNHPSASNPETHFFMTANPGPRALSSPSPTYMTEPFMPSDVQSVGSSSAPPTSFSSSKELTEEHASILNNLRNSNLPPAQIAHLMEVMTNGREVGSGAGISRANATPNPEAPPGYDFTSHV
jgi:hypothetical protein